MLSSHLFLFFCQPSLLPPFTVPCKMVLARPYEQVICPQHFRSSETEDTCDGYFACAKNLQHACLVFCLRENGGKMSCVCARIIVVVIIIIFPFTSGVVEAPQMISQLLFSIFPCSPLPSVTWRTPGLFIT